MFNYLYINFTVTTENDNINEVKQFHILRNVNQPQVDCCFRHCDPVGLTVTRKPKTQILMDAHVARGL